MSKKVLVVVGGIVLVLAVFIWQVVANLNSIVASVIEDVGTEVLETEVKVSGLAITLKEGKVGIAGLTIANPEGYSRAKLIEMEGIEVTLDIASLNQEVLVIKSIRIHNPRISFEVDADGGNNMQTLLDNMGSDSSADETVVDGEEKRMIIDLLEFSGGHVKASSSAKPGEVTDINLPAINMSGIGRKKGGITADVAAEKIAKELIGEIISVAVKASINKAIKKEAQGLLDKLKGDG
jgi:hypothetical protein